VNRAFSLLTVALFLPFMGGAQTGPEETWNEGTMKEARVLIVPFEQKLFYCDIMRELTTENQMSANEIYSRMRNEIQLSLLDALKDSIRTATFLSTDSIESEDLIGLYAVMGYDHVPVPIEKEKGEKGRGKKVEQPKDREVGIRNGQVVAERDLQERYMKTVLNDHTVLHQFYSKYGTDRFLFINQMDVKMDLADPETAFIDPKRVVAIHYTFMDKDGKEMGGGLASAQFPGTESRLNRIIGSTFHRLSAQVLGKMVEKEKEHEE